MDQRVYTPVDGHGVATEPELGNVAGCRCKVCGKIDEHWLTCPIGQCMDMREMLSKVLESPSQFPSEFVRRAEFILSWKVTQK